MAPVRIVFWKKWARTEVHQTVDMRDPTNVRVEFHLLHSVSSSLCLMLEPRHTELQLHPFMAAGQPCNSVAVSCCRRLNMLPCLVIIVAITSQQDMMSHLSGSWHFEQLQPPSSSSLGSTRVTYKFEMWPKGEEHTAVPVTA